MKSRIVGLLILLAAVALIGPALGAGQKRGHLKRSAVAPTKTTFKRELINGVVADQEVVVVKGETLADSGLVPADEGCFALTTPEPGVYAISNSLDGVTWRAAGSFRAPEEYAIQCYEPPISPVPFYVEVTRIGD
jgi:hypothetical protein